MPLEAGAREQLTWIRGHVQPFVATESQNNPHLIQPYAPRLWQRHKSKGKGGRVNYEMVFRYLEKEKSIPKVG
jgi:hypothetical protein